MVPPAQAVTELRPWQGGESILEAVRRIASDPSSRAELPDEPPRDPSKLSWSAGSSDGVATHHTDLGAEPSGGRRLRLPGRSRDPVDEIHARLVALSRHDRDHDRRALYRLAQRPDILQFVDPVLERIVGEPSLVPQLATHARWLITVARHRGPAKLGIALLGACGEPDDIELIKPFAAHDEFTLYCSVAFTNLVEDPVDGLWEAAKAAGGWGKIQAVERLAPLVGDRPDVQRWLLVDGCANAVMNEYLAYTCATAGGLAAALNGDVDDALLDGACTIVSALCVDGPAEDLAHYEDGPLVIERLVDLLQERGTTLSRLDTAIVIRRRLRDDSGHAESDDADGRPLRAVSEAQAHQIELGWTEGLRSRLVAACGALLARPEWPDRVRVAFSSGDRRDEWLAWQIAPEVGVDLWDEAFAQLEARPLDEGLVSRVVHVRDRARRQRVIAWAEANLPLHLVSTGPQKHLFPEEDVRDVNQALAYVVQEMRDGEVYSEPLVAAAIRSPVISTRNVGLNALQTRSRGEWGSGVETAVRQLASDEPTERVRARVRALLE